VVVEVRDPISGREIFPAAFDEWTYPSLAEIPAHIDLRLPMSASYFKAPSAMRIGIVAWGQDGLVE
jgi:hypothetical protein